MIDNQDGIREKDISCFSGKRHKNKDSLKQFIGDVSLSEQFEEIDDSDFMDDLNGEDYESDDFIFDDTFKPSESECDKVLKFDLK